MTFKKVRSKNVRLEVKLNIANEDGEYEEESFFGSFKRPTKSQAQEIMARFDSKDDPISDDELIDAWMVGWDGIEDEKGAEIKFTKKTLDDMKDVFGFSGAVSITFLQLCMHKKMYEILLKGNS